MAMATTTSIRKGTVVYSTGILRKSPRTRFALVDAVNLGRLSRKITVQVIDWSSGSPLLLKVAPCNKLRCTQTVGSKKSVFLYANVSGIRFKYEVRITQPANSRFITNVFGVTKMPYKPLEGGTVLQHDLVKIGKQG